MSRPLWQSMLIGGVFAALLAVLTKLGWEWFPWRFRPDSPKL